MYLDFISLFQSAHNAVNSAGTFYHGRVSDANLAIDNNPLPQIHVYPFKVKPENGVDVSTNILIAFIFQDSPHSSDTDRNVITDQADTMARKFVQYIDSQSDEIRSWEIEPFYKQFSGVTSGVFLRLSMVLPSSKVCSFD